jgi:hypothetical protein
LPSSAASSAARSATLRARLHQQTRELAAAQHASADPAERLMPRALRAGEAALRRLEQLSAAHPASRADAQNADAVQHEQRLDRSSRRAGRIVLAAQT